MYLDRCAMIPTTFQQQFTNYVLINIIKVYHIKYFLKIKQNAFEKKNKT